MFLRILTGKKLRQIKLQRLQKVQIWVFGLLVQQINSLKEVLTKTKFSKNKIVTGKTPFFLRSPFCSHHFICLNIGFWHGTFVWKWRVFNLSALTKKRYSSFLKMVFVFHKICFKVKVLKTFFRFQWLSHKNEFAKLCAFRAYVLYVPMHLTCLRAFVPQITMCLRALNSYVPTCLRATCLRALRAYMPLNFTCLWVYVLYVPTCL